MPASRIRWPFPRRSRRRLPPGVVPVVAGVVGAGLGAIAQYLLDTARGHARRARLRDQASAAARRSARRMRHTAVQSVTTTRGRARGLAHRLVPSTEPVDDRTLVDKVRSEVFRRDRFARHVVNIDAFNGVVTLRGQLEDDAAIRDLVSAVGAVRGVRKVESLLHTPHTTAPNVAGLQQPST
jgi:osmotically-inducible protein OsmY